MMRSKFWLGVVAGCFPAMAFAQQVSVEAASGDTQFRGSAGFACLASTPKADSVTGAVFSSSGSTAQLAFQPGTVVNQTTLIARAFQVRLTVPVTCNGAHSIVVRSARGGMQLLTPVSGAIGFDSRIDLDVGVTWLGDSNQISTSGSPIGLTLSKTSAGSGSVEVTVNGRAGLQPLVGGRYSDEIIVDLLALQ